MREALKVNTMAEYKAADEMPEILFWVGCAGGFDDRAKKVTRALVKLLNQFIHPEVFAKYKVIGLEKGFRYVESGPMIRSSYHAEKHIF